MARQLREAAYLSSSLDFMMHLQTPMVHREMCFNLLTVSSVAVLRSLGNGLPCPLSYSAC